MGWETVSFQDKRLGWVKHFKKRANNNYPKSFVFLHWT